MTFSGQFLRDGCLEQFCFFNGLWGILTDRFGRKARNEGVGSINGRHRHHIGMQIANCVTCVHLEGRSLPVVEAELDRSFRLRFVNFGLAWSVRSVYSAAGRLLSCGLTAKRGTLTGKAHIFGWSWWSVRPLSTIFEADTAPLLILISQLCRDDSLRELLDKLGILRILNVSKLAIVTHLKPILPQDNLDVGDVVGALRVIPSCPLTFSLLNHSIKFVATTGCLSRIIIRQATFRCKKGEKKEIKSVKMVQKWNIEIWMGGLKWNYLFLLTFLDKN